MNDTTDNAVLPVQPPRPLSTSTSPMSSAVELLKAGVTTEQLKEMMAMQLQWEANEARKAYNRAMTEFKLNPPTIIKDTLVDFPSKGGRTTYKHAKLGAVCDAVIDALAKHGFSHRWDTRTSEAGIYVSCILTHEAGHSESYEMGPGRPDESGGKNSIQAIASTQTYFQRYSLLGICGLTSNDMQDDDGRASEPRKDDYAPQEWIDAVGNQPTLEDLSDLKTRGFAAMKKRGDTQTYEAFKKAVLARKAELEQPEPGSEG